MPRLSAGQARDLDLRGTTVLGRQKNLVLAYSSYPKEVTKEYYLLWM